MRCEAPAVEDVDVVAAGVARARASPTAETNVDRSYVGQPVQIVWDVGTSGGGGRLSAGVVCFAEGSRIHVVEPRRGDVLAPGVGSTGLAETAEWVAMGLHRDALDRAVRANRAEPRQNGPGYLVLEFALCSDGRWHKVDAFDRKLATTAELLDEEALVTALRAARRGGGGVGRRRWIAPRTTRMSRDGRRARGGGGDRGVRPEG